LEGAKSQNVGNASIAKVELILHVFFHFVFKLGVNTLLPWKSGRPTTFPLGTNSLYCVPGCS